MLINIDAYYAKLGNKEEISEEEIVQLLKELKDFRSAAAWMASCHAASADLPKSASKSAKTRMKSICETAEKAMIGDMSGIKFPTKLEHAREHCQKAVERLNAAEVAK